MRDPAERLRDIVAAIALIERYAERGRDAFYADELVQNWILRHLQIIGEAARSIPIEVRQAAPDIPWSKITGMRHVLFMVTSGSISTSYGPSWSVISSRYERPRFNF